MNDLQPGMILEGAVTSITNFGAFVDIGVHQDGTVYLFIVEQVWRKIAYRGESGRHCEVKVLKWIFPA